MNGDTATRSATTPVDTVSSGTHSDGSASAHPSGNSTHTQDHVRTPSDSQSDNSVNDYRVTSIHPSNQTVSWFYDRLTVTISKRFTLLSLTKLSRMTLTLSHFSTQSHNSTQLIHSLRSITRTGQLSHMQVSRRSCCRPQHESAKTKKQTVKRGGQCPRKWPVKGRSTRKTVDRKFVRD